MKTRIVNATLWKTRSIVSAPEGDFAVGSSLWKTKEPGDISTQLG